MCSYWVRDVPALCNVLRAGAQIGGACPNVFSILVGEGGRMAHHLTYLAGLLAFPLNPYALPNPLRLCGVVWPTSLTGWKGRRFGDVVWDVVARMRCGMYVDVGSCWEASWEGAWEGG